jgi:ABC-type polysaccharide/polyol phosphate export permease
VSRSPAAAALRDLSEGAKQWPQWFTLGNFEIRLRFRRTGLGPVWTSLSFALLLAALGFVYARVLATDARTYIPWLALGLLVWTFAATILQEACELYVHAAHTLKQLDVPKSAFLYRLMWRNLVLLAFNGLVAAAALALCRVRLGPEALLALPGLLLLCLNLLWAALLLALAGARFWAASRLVQALLPVAMLATPIIWRPVTPALHRLADWNPAYWAVELVRGPLLGAAPPPAIWAAFLLLALAGTGGALILFAKLRDRLIYWL